MNKIQVICGEGQGAYTVTLTGNDIRHVALHPHFKGKKGEALVAALVAVDKGIQQVARRNKKGDLHDGAQGQAAFELLRDGEQQSVSHYNKGQLTASKDYIYVPSSQLRQSLDTGRFERRLLSSAVLDANGQWTTREYDFSSGKLSRIFSEAKDGRTTTKNFEADTLHMVWHEKDGSKHDTADGIPALLQFTSRGKLYDAVRFENGKKIKRLNKQIPNANSGPAKTTAYARRERDAGPGALLNWI